MIMARTKQGIEMYLDAMKELEERARACYEGTIGLSSNKFTEMLFLDGCFVLELFRGADKGFSELGYVSFNFWFFSVVSKEPNYLQAFIQNFLIIY